MSWVLQLRNKHPKRRVKAKLREDRLVAVGPNDVWAMDFVHDQLATGRKLRILTVVDTHSSFRPRRSDPGTCLQAGRLCQDDQGRQRPTYGSSSENGQQVSMHRRLPAQP